MEKRIGAIILAAGEGKRFGGSKMLLQLPDSKSLVRHVVDIVTGVSFDRVFVITGKDSSRIEKELISSPVVLMKNPQWELGMSTSIKLGINSLAPFHDACMIVLGDQPFITAGLLEKLLETYYSCRCQVVYPEVNGRQTNPVLLDKSTFASLLTIEGDIGARKMLSSFSFQPLQWEDERLLIDIDTDNDFERVKSLMLLDSD
jgi:molybdenum cofactor cytidylyltransferase